MVGADNFSARPTLKHAPILTNCFIASVPGNEFWTKYIDNQMPHLEETVLTSFGTWALTDFVRAYKPRNFIELPSFYFNWIPNQMHCEPVDFTYALHHSETSWVEEGRNWYDQD